MSLVAAPVRDPALEQAVQAMRRVEDNIGQVIRGKAHAIELAVTTLLARGHLLIEDVPGVGKTTLARALAHSLGGTFRRIQFTSDLLPSDILGVSVYDATAGQFQFKPGPIFANVVLADEINRATPRTQSALLEAMAEEQVSVDNQTHSLQPPFLVIATQNPLEHFGTYPLPESQMDRFLLRIRLGYPEPADEKRVLRERTGDDPIELLQPVIDLTTVCDLQARVEKVRVDEALVDYSLQVILETRRSPYLTLGASTRGGLAWYRAAQALALVSGRDYCIPDDFKQLAIPALAHRVVLGTHEDSLERDREEAERILLDILARIPVPT